MNTNRKKVPLIVPDQEKKSAQNVKLDQQCGDNFIKTHSSCQWKT